MSLKALLVILLCSSIGYTEKSNEIHSGDQDSKVPFTATRTIANNLAKELNLYTVIPYGPWYDNKQVNSRLSYLRTGYMYLCR
jgi:hypothetical protein